jgi:serine/threonine protein kinase
MNEQLGTPQYAAPEIFDQKPYTNKVDMWSTGVVLYNMINGTQPFSNKDIENLKSQVLHKDIVYNGFKNNILIELCKGLLERDPDKRLTAFQAKKKLDLIKPGNMMVDTVPGKFDPTGITMFVLYNDRTTIEELKNIFLSECTPEELNKMFEEILTLNSKNNQKNNTEGNMDMVSEKLYMKAEKLIEFTLNSKISPEKLKIRLKNYCKQKVIEKIKNQMINIDNFFITLIESIKFIRRTRCLNEFTKMDKYNLGWLSVKQIDNYFIDPIKKHNIKTKLKPNEKIEFETFYKLYNEYNGIKIFVTTKHK